MNVNIYMDLNGQWVSGDRGSAIEWEYSRIIPEEGKNSLQRWRIEKQEESLFTEFHDRAEWGTLHFSAPVVGYSFPLGELFEESTQAYLL